MQCQKNILNSLLFFLFLIKSVLISNSLCFRINDSFNSTNILLNQNKKGSYAFDLELFHLPEKNTEYFNYLKETHLNYLNLIQKTSHSTNLGLHKHMSTSYVGYIYIGSPPQIIPVIFDTGSGYNWVASKYCYTNQKCKKTEAPYISNKSKTNQKTEYSIKVIFGKGEVSGPVSRDVVAISPEIIDMGEYIGEMKNIEDVTIFKGGASGLFGLAFNTTSAFNRTFFDGLVLSKTLTRNVIGFYFSPNSGQINFGYIDKTKYKGEIHSHPVIDFFYWTIEMSDIKIGNETIGFCEGKRCKAVIDTGSSGIAVPSGIYNILVDKINLNPDCSNLAQLPDLNFVMNNQTYTLSPQEYALILLDITSSQKSCLLNLMPIDIPRFPENDAIVIGDNFLGKYYTVFDYDNSSVRFALRK